MPSNNQLNAAIKKHNDEMKDGFTVSLGVVKKFCEDRKDVPYSDHEPFVLGYDVSKLGEEPSFIYIVTTKTLLTHATLLSDHITIDATYKVVLQKFSLVLIGSNDKWNKYHPFGIAVVARERKEDYFLIFTKFKEGLERVLGVII